MIPYFLERSFQILRERILGFLSKLGVPKTAFCIRAVVDVMTLNKYLGGEEISQKSLDKLDAYLSRYNR